MTNRKMRRAAKAGTKLPPPLKKRPSVDPVFLSAFLDEGWELLHKGQEAAALEIAKRAIRLQETEDSKRLFVECVKSWRDFPDSENFRDVIARALREEWGPSAYFLGISKGLLEKNPAIVRAAGVWPHRLALDELLEPSERAAVAGDPLLLALISSDKNINLDLEPYLTSVRAGLLAISQGGGDDAGLLPLACALARQCFANEYVWEITDEESDRAGRLRDLLVGMLQAKKQISSFALAVLASYRPLDDLPGSQALLRQPWPRSMVELLELQLREPAEQRRHRKAIPRLTAIRDDISIAVQAQYEENPYPRWVRLPPAVAPRPVDDWFREKFPFSNVRRLGKAADLDVLIAGCGTGHHALLFAQGFPMAKVLAIDLSLSSLAYARQKTRAIGMSNIEYAQADILDLSKLGRTFDIISSSGVLHHLADPLKGWRELLMLLVPDGLMHVGLYSEAARRNIAVARSWLAARGYSPNQTVARLRSARQELIAAAAGDTSLNEILTYPDFFSTSEFRDLLFHRQEQDFTIPQIRNFLDNNNLQFIGFNISDDILHQFRRRYSTHREADLAAWHEFEIERPYIFKGMYQFWVQRRGASII